MSSSTAAPILPKPQPLPFILIPVTFASSTQNQTLISNNFIKANNGAPIAIDHGSLKKNLQVNKQSLQHKLAKRPGPNTLIERGILRNASVDPLVQVRGQLLKRNKLADNLNSKLRKRPGPLELVTKKILQVDAELEQAIQEGRLPFTPVETTEGSSTKMISTQLAPNRFEDMQQQQQIVLNQSAFSSTGPKAKIRKKSQQIHRASTPYDSNSNIGSKLVKLKSGPVSKKFQDNVNLSENMNNCISSMETDHPLSLTTNRLENNYEITLKQQQIFLQWQEEHTKNPIMECAVTPAMSSSTSNCSTPLQSIDGIGIQSARSSFSLSSAQSSNQATRLSSVCSRSASPTIGGDMPVVMEMEKPKSKLADFKVQDLKNECKKRQLPVSGPKPQLLERLKPYEDAILASMIAENIDRPSSSNYDQYTTCNHRHMTTCQSMPNQPAQDVIHDYLQQCQPNSQQKSLLLQIPQNGNIVQVVNKQQDNPVLFKLVDSTGSVVGVATVPQNMPAKSTVPCTCAQCTNPQLIVNSGEQYIFSDAKVYEPTFSFSQMGSGGQFTLAKSTTVPECRSMVPNCAGCIAAVSQCNTFDPVNKPKLLGRNDQFTSFVPPSAKPTTNLVNASPALQVLQPKPIVEAEMPPVVLRRHSASSIQITQPEERSNSEMADSTDFETPDLSATDANQLEMDEGDVSVDETDIQNLLTAKTFAQHEENLQRQQKLIDDLQKELANSQELLRKEQKLIIAAKKSQLRTDITTGKHCTQAEILLNNLDVKNVNKMHIQHFLQHKSQQQTLQNSANNYQHLFQVEQNLQEELHIEQAVQDIVRLIKQDGRTALLIVQLLRRYQLERNHQLQVNKEQQPNNTPVNTAPNKETSKTAQIVVIDDTPVSSPVVEKTESVKETTTKPKNAKGNKRKNVRSIWSKTESDKSTKPATEKSPVDMEEIFRSVIDATRDTQSEPKTANIEESVANDASSDLVPQLNGFHLVTNEDFSQHADDSMQYTNPTEICTTAVFIHEENASRCDVDCYTKPANANSPERVRFSKQREEFVAQQYEFNKNEDFEDLMDVLRDDQQGVTNYSHNNSSFNGKEILGYTPGELANFLAAECENEVNGNNQIYEAPNGGQFVVMNNYANYYQPQNYEIDASNMENETVPIEPHQEQAIEDILNGEMLETSIEWFDNLFQSPMPDRQPPGFVNGRQKNHLQRPMDAFV
uniref:SAP domain-containing protein n=1 Tax=Panagrolaimus sp. JU765 TaxID=591449 RepID=A0AC34Q347_9BILA